MNPRRHRHQFLFLIAIALVCGTPVRAVAARRYAFAFANDERTPEAYARLLMNPQIDGLAAGGIWARLEPREGEFNWRDLDEALDAAAASRKKITLHVFGAFFGRPPNWLEAAGVRFFSAPPFRGRQIRGPVPWDAVYLTKWTDFVRALSAHLAERKALRELFAVSVTVPAPEMSLPFVRDGRLGDGVAYDRAAYLAAWKRMIDVYQAAFPSSRKFICAPHRGNIAFGDGDENFYREVMAYAQKKGGGSFGVFATDLTALGSDRTELYHDEIARSSLGYQMIGSAINDSGGRMKGGLGEAVRRGISNGATYFEFYASDVENPAKTTQDAIRAAHTP